MATAIEMILASIPEQERVRQALVALDAKGARVFLVGGAVRDFFLHRPIHDCDLEVHGIALEALQQVLAQFGFVNVVGKSFGVLRWEHSVVDWALPRRDFSGRKPEVELDPDLAMSEALRRRDLTINAMAIACKTGELIDPFGGRADLEQRIARSPDTRFFAEDPLRFYRVMQFVGRFELTPDAALNDICAAMAVHDVSRERIAAEFDKLFLLSAAPSRGIRWIQEIGRLHELLPEIAATCGVAQPPQWHPEGDVFEHLMQACDAAAQGSYADDEERITIVSAALCHDLGKALATRVIEGRVRSIGHEIEGVPCARACMQRIALKKKRIDTVCVLVRHHMDALNFTRNKTRDSTYKRLALQLAPLATIRMLSYVVIADARGRNSVRGVPLAQAGEMVERFVVRAQKLGVFDGPEKPVLVGADFLDVLTPGTRLGRAVARAYEIQIYENMHDKEKLKRRVLAELVSMD